MPTRLRRSFFLLSFGLTVMVASGAVQPAHASFADSASVSTTVETAEVAAPSSVTATAAKCVGRFTTVTISWPASPSPKVSGYLVTVYWNNGLSQTVTQTDAGTLTITASTEVYYIETYQPRFIVTTLTSYGWTKESAPSATIAC